MWFPKPTLNLALVQIVNEVVGSVANGDLTNPIENPSRVPVVTFQGDGQGAVSHENLQLSKQGLSNPTKLAF